MNNFLKWLSCLFGESELQAKSVRLAKRTNEQNEQAEQALSGSGIADSEVEGATQEEADEAD